MFLMFSPLKLELERTMSDDKVEAQIDYWRDVSWTAIIFGALLALCGFGHAANPWHRRNRFLS